MRILIAPDKFKGSLEAREAAEQIAAGIRDVMPNAEIVVLPIADGGEGTADALCAATQGEWLSCNVHDPLGRIVSAKYCTIRDGRTAVMEMSEASGLFRVSENERDPVHASSLGTGEMLLHAAKRNAEEIVLGLGGSATNDGGFGMARALGFRFVDHAGAELTGDVSSLLRLAHVHRPDTLHLPQIIAAADVQAPLLGPRGATRVFGPQKGATPKNVELLEQALTRLADVVAQDLNMDPRNVPGAGAAGGLGFALISFCGARVRPGFDVVAEAVGLESAVRDTDIVITGEGRLDRQTLEGKAPAGVARLARRLDKPVYAIVGSCEAKSGADELFDEVVTLTRGDISAAEAQRHAARLLRERARELGATLQPSRS
jgi:glycerate 2-kinase